MARKKRRSSSSFFKIFFWLCLIIIAVYFSINLLITPPHIFYPNFQIDIPNGYEIHGMLDYRCVEDLARVNGDLGRMGGLLKLWLTNDERIMKFGPVRVRAMILRLLAKIEGNQDGLRKIINAVIPG